MFVYPITWMELERYKNYAGEVSPRRPIVSSSLGSRACPVMKGRIKSLAR